MDRVETTYVLSYAKSCTEGGPFFNCIFRIVPPPEYCLNIWNICHLPKLSFAWSFQESRASHFDGVKIKARQWSGKTGSKVNIKCNRRLLSAGLRRISYLIWRFAFCGDFMHKKLHIHWHPFFPRVLRVTQFLRKNEKLLKWAKFGQKPLFRPLFELRSIP